MTCSHSVKDDGKKPEKQILSCSRFELLQMLPVCLPGCPASVAVYLGHPFFRTPGHTVENGRLMKSSIKAQ